MTDTIDVDQNQSDPGSRKARMIAAGAILDALAASTCCIIPLILFSLGVSGAWIRNLAVLSRTTEFLMGANVLTAALVATLGSIVFLAARNFMRMRNRKQEFERGDQRERQTS